VIGPSVNVRLVASADRMAIDTDALGAVEDCCWEWRSAFPNLGEIYVPGEGVNEYADDGEALAFIIGEAPGAQEVMYRRPFIGPAGQVLRDLMLLADLCSTDQWSHGSDKFPETTGVVKPNCWLTNVVKFRPPGNRKPTDAEIKVARPSLRREWLAVGSPDIIIPVGSTALEAVLGHRESILRSAGKCHKATSKAGNPLYIWPMVHPSFGLRNPAVQPVLERDWERLGEFIRGAY